MKFNSKYILFALIGVASTFSLQAEAKDLLLNIASHAGKYAIEHNKDTAQEKINSYSKPQVAAKDIKTPGLCPEHYPLGAPMVITVEKEKIDRRSFYLCQDDYAVQFDPATKNPIWVSEKLVGTEHDNERVERVDNFQPNPYVPYGAQATLNDYKGSHLDRGHNAPAADMRTPQAMEQSFYLTNMFPQVGPNMNRGIWADLEAMVRKWSVARGEVLVVTGPIFGQGTKTMGHSQVWVPTHLYKIVLDPRTNESLAFMMPNQQIVTRKTKTIDQGNPEFPQTTPEQAINCGRTCTIDDFIVPLTEIEKYTGLQFFPKMNMQQKQQASQKGRMWAARH